MKPEKNKQTEVLYEFVSEGLVCEPALCFQENNFLVWQFQFRRFFFDFILIKLSIWGANLPCHTHSS